MTKCASVLAACVVALLFLGCETSDGSCQSMEEACDLFCKEGKACELWENDADCLSTCRGMGAAQDFPNLVHDCIAEESCSFLEDVKPCMDRKQAAFSYSCTDKDIKICDEEGCCLPVSCAASCGKENMPSAGCGYSEEKKHDTCLCISSGSGALTASTGELRSVPVPFIRRVLDSIAVSARPWVHGTEPAR